MFVEFPKALVAYIFGRNTAKFFQTVSVSASNYAIIKTSIQFATVTLISGVVMAPQG